MCDETDSIVNQSDMECYHSLSASHSTRHRTASEILHDQLSALNQSHAAHNVQSSFLYGCKPPWGWDYMLCFKMPKLLYSQLFDTHTDTHTEAQSTVLSIPHVDQYDPDAADDLPLHVDSKSNDRNQQRVQILARLKSAGFSFSQLLVPSERAILVRISLCEALLKEKAVLIGMQLKLQKKYGSGYLPFSHDKAHVFENYQVAQHRSSYFSPAERALIILRVLQSKESWGCHLNLERLLYEKHLIKAFALHSTHEHKSLIHRCVWQNCWDPTWQPPFDDMKNYLGGKFHIIFFISLTKFNKLVLMIV